MIVARAQRVGPRRSDAPTRHRAAIDDTLLSGTSLVVDRYAFSGVAFTAAKAGMSLHWCKVCDAGLPAPDAVLFLDMDVDEAARRGAYGEERYERVDMQRRVQANFRAMRDGGGCGEWHTLDAARPQEDVAADMLRIARDTVRSVGERAARMDQLWPELVGDKEA